MTDEQKSWAIFAGYMLIALLTNAKNELISALWVTGMAFLIVGWEPKPRKNKPK